MWRPDDRIPKRRDGVRTLIVSEEEQHIGLGSPCRPGCFGRSKQAKRRHDHAVN
jgi:hypothetical protein